MKKKKILRSFTLKQEVVEMLEQLRDEKYIYNTLSDIVNDSIEKQYKEEFQNEKVTV